MQKLLFVLFTVLSFSFVSCSDDNDDTSKSSMKAVTNFSINDINGTISEDDKTILLTLPFGTDLTKLKPTIKISDKAKITPNTGTEVDFSNPVMYKVTAEDNSTVEYTVTVLIGKNTESKITSFSIDNISGIIDEEKKTIAITLPKGADVTKLKPLVKVSANAAYSPTDETVNFTSPVVFKITAENGNTSEYTVTVNIEKSSEAIIKTFGINSISDLKIDETAKTIKGTVDYGFAINALTPTITISEDAKISPATGVTQDFTNPITYTVTAQDGTVVKYTATITVKPFEASISTVSDKYFLEGDVLSINGKFGTSNNKVTFTKGNTSIEGVIVSQSATKIEVKVPTITEETNYELSVVANGSTAKYNEQVALFKAGKPAIFFSNKTVFQVGTATSPIQDPIVITGRNFIAKTSAVSYILATTTVAGAYNNIKLGIETNTDGTVATRYSLGILDRGVEYSLSIFVDGVESGTKLKVTVEN